MVLESLLCLRHGQQLFERTRPRNIVAWLIVQFIVSVVLVIGCVWWDQAFKAKKEKAQDKSD